MDTFPLPRAPWRAWLAALLAAMVCALLPACGGGGADAPAATADHRQPAALRVGGRLPPLPPLVPLEAASPVVAYTSPAGLVASTGNLYWTSTAVDEFGPDVSTVWRAGKDNVAGREIALYREWGDDRRFGDIVYAYVGDWYGYFVATYQTPAGLVSQIKRVPLVGGAAVPIATSPAPGARDLRTDGTTLYWIDAGGIRSVAVGGGAVRTLYADAFVARLALDEEFVYFGEEYLVMRIPKAGGAPQFVAATNGRVSALYVEGGGSRQAFWGDVEGGVYSVRTDTGPWTPAVYQQPSPGREVKAIGNAFGPLWVDCAQPGNTDCRIRHFHAGVLVCCAVGIAHLQTDREAPIRFYWGDAGALRRYP